MTRRVQKVAELLRQQLAIMVKETLPEDLGIVTVMDVQVSTDIKNAMVYISCLDEACQDEVFKRLTDKTKDFQHILGRQLQMRYTPKLTFKIDRGLEKINRVEKILENIDK